MSQENMFMSSMKAAPQHSAVGPLRVCVCPSTGGSLELCVPITETVQGLKNAVSKKLKISPNKINLLYRNMPLEGGCLRDYHIVNGSRLMLLPNMESGMTFQRPEAGVMQALENLSESQVSDFLSGRAPLLLAMRMGDHMMFVQLQLTTQCSGRGRGSRAGATLANSPGFDSISLTQRLRDITHPKGSKQAAKQSGSPKPPSSSPSCSTCCSPPIPGAVIDSMQNIGQGIYSGTFSGTLAPTLQDKDGRPKRDVSTILHILNDLLGASSKFSPSSPPPYHHHPQSQQAPSGFFQAPSASSQTPENSVSASQNQQFTSSNGNISSSEAFTLRKKMKELQAMMEQRRLHRKARRETKAPYHWSHPSQNPSPIPAPQHFRHPATQTSPNTELAESMETSTYRKPNMEQEPVAV